MTRGDTRQVSMKLPVDLLERIAEVSSNRTDFFIRAAEDRLEEWGRFWEMYSEYRESVGEGTDDE